MPATTPSLRTILSHTSTRLSSPQPLLRAATPLSRSPLLFTTPHLAQPSPRLPSRLFSLARTMTTDMRFKNPAILVCDMQEKFRNAIYEFDNIVLTSQKLLSFAQSASIPVYATTQSVAKLGPTVPALASLISSTPLDKTKFSMLLPPLIEALPAASRIALVGIESHICITQTALDLRDAGHYPYVIADAVSSCNRAEVIVALDRLRSEPGIVVTTSESWMYECVGDASHPSFKGLIGVVKGSAADTKKVLGLLPPTSKM